MFDWFHPAPRDLTAADLRARLRQACAEAGSQSAWARKHDIPISTVSSTLNSDREPSESVANALGLIRVTRFRAIAKGKI